jgi:elongation factor P--(R)-beta-lysine ligase
MKRDRGVLTHGRLLAGADDLLVVSVGAEVLHLEAPAEAPALRAGDFISWRAEPATPGRATALDLVARPEGAPDFPRGGSDFLRFHGHDARLYRNIQARARLLAALRAFFDGQGFMEAETPVIVESPGVETHLAAVEVALTPAPGAGIHSRYLITSPEYHMKRLLGVGFKRVYQIARVFRDGEAGRRHRPEFSMVEWYRAFDSYEALMTDCEALVAALSGGAEALLYQGREIDLCPPWPRLPFRQALMERAGIPDPDRLSPEEQLEALVTHVEPTLGMTRPEFLVEYPASMASLARRKPGDPRVAERFELYIGGIELANGFSELVDPAEQAARFDADLAEREALGLPRYPVDEAFLDALRDGVPPSTGVALGLDRLFMVLLDADDIDQVIAYS